MTQAFTQNDLVRYAYGEMLTLERLEMEFSLTENTEMCEEYKELQRTQQELPVVTFSPSRETMAKILSYSKDSSLEATT